MANMVVNFSHVPVVVKAQCVSFLDIQDVARYVTTSKNARKEVELGGRSYRLNLGAMSPACLKKIVIISDVWVQGSVGFPNLNLSVKDAMNFFSSSLAQSSAQSVQAGLWFEDMDKDLAESRVDIPDHPDQVLPKITWSFSIYNNDLFGDNLTVDPESENTLAEAGFQLGVTYFRG